MRRGVERVRWLWRAGSRLKPHRYGGALCALDHTGGYLFPLNNIVFAPPQKHLMHLECIKRACNVRTRVQTSVATHGDVRCAAGAASRWNVAVGALPASLFPLNNSVFAPSQKHLMHLECIKRACNIRLNAAHVRRKIGWLLPVLCTSFVNIFKTLLLHVALLPEKW